MASSIEDVVCKVLGSFSVISASFQQFGRRRRVAQLAVLVALSAFMAAGLSGCSRLRSKPAAQYVYVTAKQTFLRDRVACWLLNWTTGIDQVRRRSTYTHLLLLCLALAGGDGDRLRAR